MKKWLRWMDRCWYKTNQEGKKYTNQEVALAHLQTLHEDSILVDGEDAAGGVDQHHVLPEHGPQVDRAPGNLRRHAIDEHRHRRQAPCCNIHIY